jgi:hypothetical protein
VGSKVTIQLENSTVTTSTNFPSGRHSAYRAFTTVQNRWETLEFDYEQTLDGGTSVLSINNVAVLFQPSSYTGDTYYFDNVRILRQPEPPVVATTVLENYDGTSAISFDATGTNGAYTAGVANPSASGVNTSAKVAKYVRNGTQQYDVLFFDAKPAGTVIQDAGKFKDQRYQLALDLYTDAPVGTNVRITLQNKAAAAGTYPAGRNSTYILNTTKQNAWETLTLVYDGAPDGGTANVAIDQLAVLLAGNTTTSNTYYLDNIRIVKHVADPTYAAGTTLEDYDTTHNLTYLSSDGAYVPNAANPAAAAPNTSAKVGKYTRKATASYDVLSFGTSAVPDGAAFVKGNKVFALDLYTTAPAGTVISWQLEASMVSTPGNYPSGRHSIYQAAVQKSNAWQTLTFTYANSPDTSTPDASVDRVVLLAAPNSSTGDVYYFDNLRTLTASSTATNAAPTVSLTSPSASDSYAAPASLTLAATAADADGSVAKVEFYQGATLLGTSTASPYRYTWTGVAAGTYSLTAKATDNQGATTTSAAVSVTVGAATSPNLALNKPTVTSSTENGGTPGSAAVDGDATTRWSSAFADPQWLYVDLGATYSLNRVRLTWEGAYGKDYQIQTSPDASTWTTIKTVTGNTALDNDLTGLSGTGRYVRLYGTARGTQYGYSLYELAVYGTAASGGGGSTSSACTGTAANGDYSYEVSTAGSSVNWKFTPLSPIAGSSQSIIYVKAGAATGYAGYPMTAAGGSFTFAQAQATGTAISFYFTYRVGTSTSERTSAGSPHSYTVGTTCATARSAAALATTAQAQASSAAVEIYPNPVATALTVELPGPAAHTLTLRDVRGATLRVIQVAAGLPRVEVDMARFAPGVYLLTVAGGEGQKVHRILKN